MDRKVASYKRMRFAPLDDLAASQVPYPEDCLSWVSAHVLHLQLNAPRLRPVLENERNANPSRVPFRDGRVVPQAVRAATFRKRCLLGLASVFSDQRRREAL